MTEPLNFASAGATRKRQTTTEAKQTGSRRAVVLGLKKPGAVVAPGAEARSAGLSVINMTHPMNPKESLLGNRPSGCHF
jgi:hypothetical protein